MSKLSAKVNAFKCGGATQNGTAKNDHLNGTGGDDQLSGLGSNDHLRGNGGNAMLFGGAGDDHLWGGNGNDRLEGQPTVTDGKLRAEINFLRGGAGDDPYFVNGPGDRVFEKAGAGIDTVYTTVGFTLPAHVENLFAHESFQFDDRPLVGNALNNIITGSPFSNEVIRGLDGNDTLNGGGRFGGFLDGGNGNDILIQTIGQSLGGAGADLFVAAGRGGNTRPDVPVVVLDFKAVDGDRIHIVNQQNYDSAELFQNGQLRFDASTSELTLNVQAPEFPNAIDQIVFLPGVQQFDASWVTVGLMG
ncbi:MAG: Hemolysin-type calcium-binding region [Polaromonas sp.]|nr:Hemolysin-type calcium-binding region [Polaromonas sp.]